MISGVNEGPWPAAGFHRISLSDGAAKQSRDNDHGRYTARRSDWEAGRAGRYGERFVNRPWGLFGGGSGGTGKFAKLTRDGEVALPTKPANLPVTAQEAIVVETPGAGGYGKPAERDKAAIENDAVSGKFSRGFIKEHYGVEPKGER